VKESEIQRAILDLLAAKRILAFRMNTGAMSGEHMGKTWFMRFGSPGMADVLAFPSQHYEHCGAGFDEITPLWIEVKTAKGKQSDLQRSFQQLVEEHSHRYIVVRSVDDVLAVL
jgi:hypothetical protein